MRYLRSQHGFTLVELIMVLAISALAFAAVIAAQGGIANQTGFLTAIDTTRNQLKGIQNQANQSVVDANVNGNSIYTTFGKLVEFDNSASTKNQMQTWTLIEDSAKANLYKCNEQDITFPQGVSFTRLQTGSWNKTAVVFGHSPQQTYLNSGFQDPVSGSSPNSICNPSASPPPTPISPPGLCPGFTRTLNDPEGSCPVTPPGPRTTPPACNADLANWTCGLYGQYYIGTDFSSAPNSAYIDQGIDKNMGNGANAFPDFGPTLNVRTQASSLGDAVHWTGQILLGYHAGDYPTPQPTKYCFDSDQGSKATITVPGHNAYSLTDNFGSPTPQANTCATITVTTPGWYDIDIQYATNTADNPSGTPPTQPFAHLTYADSGLFGTTAVPAQELRGCVPPTCPVFSPSAHFTNGLYGQYYTGTKPKANNSNRISAYTDPLIGDGGFNSPHGFSYSNANGLGDSDPAVFTPTLRWNTADADASNKSVRWTGQVLIDSNPTTFCTAADDGSTVIVNDNSGNPITVISDMTKNGHATQRNCGAAVALTPGWHNIQVDYENVGVSDPQNPNPLLNGAYAAVQLETASGGTYTEVPADHLRREMDWTSPGSGGSCNANQPNCTHINNSTGEYASSSGTNGNKCAGSNAQGQITYTASNLNKDNYNLDLSYFNEPNKDIFGSTYPVPGSYSYQVCVAINGTYLNNGKYYSLPISEPSLNPRTTTIKTGKISGNVTITVDWLNDSYVGLPVALGGNDANFGISRMDLYRDLNPNGSIALAPAGAPTIAGVVQSPARTPRPGNALLALLAPTVRAANNCDNNVLNPANYNQACYGRSSGGNVTQTLQFQVTGYSSIGNITVSTIDNSIERSVQ